MSDAGQAMVRDRFRSERDRFREETQDKNESPHAKSWVDPDESEQVAELLSNYGVAGRAADVLRELVARRVVDLSDVRWAAMRVQEGL